MHESTLVDNTFERIPSYLDLGNNFIASREIPAGRRYIDMLFVDFKTGFNTKSKEIYLSKIASLNTKQLSILSFFIDGKRKTQHSIADYFNIEWGKIENDYISTFKKKNLLTQIGEKTFKATDWLELIPKKLISIEAKIKDWQSVIDQAKYNTSYTAESYILFPEKSASKMSYNKRTFNKAKIGILTADNSFNVKIEHKPRFSSYSNSHITNLMKLSILKSYYKQPEKWE